mmetsp:Transcript_48030/g.139108  ORF Transcript_48030/g.139108 Transcript_48030/m.139108 type:complete len:200 (+) Transcript_48030:1646-2245(+)
MTSSRSFASAEVGLWAISCSSSSPSNEPTAALPSADVPATSGGMLSGGEKADISLACAAADMFSPSSDLESMSSPPAFNAKARSVVRAVPGNIMDGATARCLVDATTVEGTNLQGAMASSYLDKVTPAMTNNGIIAGPTRQGFLRSCRLVARTRVACRQRTGSATQSPLQRDSCRTSAPWEPPRSMPTREMGAHRLGGA